MKKAERLKAMAATALASSMIAAAPPAHASHGFDAAGIMAPFADAYRAAMAPERGMRPDRTIGRDIPREPRNDVSGRRTGERAAPAANRPARRTDRQAERSAAPPAQRARDAAVQHRRTIRDAAAAQTGQSGWRDGRDRWNRNTDDRLRDRDDDRGRDDRRDERRDDRDRDRDRWRDNDGGERRDGGNWRDRDDRQDRWDRRDRRDGRDWRNRDDDRNDRNWRDRDWRGDRHAGQRWDRRWRDSDRYDWQRYRMANRRLYRVSRYAPPYRDWRYNRFNIGFSIGAPFYSQRYWINDPWRYRLPSVYGDYRWIRYYDDVLLVDTFNGRIVDVIHDFFW